MNERGVVIGDIGGAALPNRQKRAIFSVIQFMYYPGVAHFNLALC
jgi:hypothetical protein